MFRKSENFYKQKALKELYPDSVTGRGTVDCKDYDGGGFQRMDNGLGACRRCNVCDWEGQGYLVHKDMITSFHVVESCSGVKKKTLKRKMRELERLEKEE